MAELHRHRAVRPGKNISLNRNISLLEIFQPPDHPVNGSRTWLYGRPEGSESWATVVRYQCQHGRQFDTDGDGAGDSVSVDIRCQWDKLWVPQPFTSAWSPFPSLPPCIVTHCVEPFNIPPETSLEEVTSADTPINTAKQYRCQNSWGGDHLPTMFWQSDRSQYTHQIECKDTGYFTWVEWPICLTGKATIRDAVNTQLSELCRLKLSLPRHHLQSPPSIGAHPLRVHPQH